MTVLTRRRLFGSTFALAAGAGLAACTVTKQGKVTTVTIDTARVDTDGQAICTALSSIIAAPAIIAVLGPAKLAVAAAAVTAAKAALAQFDALTHGSLSVDVDTTNAITAVQSIISDAQTVLQLVQGMASELPKAAADAVGNYTAAVLTLIPFLQLAVGLAPVAALSRTQMTEAEAVHVATH